MPFTALFEHFPEIAKRETRTITTFAPHNGLPAGAYGFLEMFCDEEGCDCRRAFIQVYPDPQQAAPNLLATISFGWENASFYRKWASYPLSKDELHSLKGPALAALTPQSEYAPELLRLFKTALRDENYVARIVRHYKMFRGVIDGESTNRVASPVRRGPKIGRNEPCHCGSGKKHKKCCGNIQLEV